MKTMSINSAFLIGLIMITQFDTLTAQASKGFCVFCNDYYNQVQCIANSVLGGCSWANGACSGSPPIINGTNITYSAANINYPKCASLTSTNCFGYDGASTNMQCIVSNQTCTSFDNSQACSSYTNMNQCSSLALCNWVPTNPNGDQTVGTCASIGCSSNTNNLACTTVFISLSAFTQQPCKWTPTTNSNTTSTSLSTAGTCGNGAASDLSQANCMSYWFTYSDALQACQYCTESISGQSNSIRNAAFIILVLAISY